MNIVTIGGLLVEIMRTDLDKSFNEQGELIGPFPSGDVAIFADAAARLGNNVAIIGTVGDDGFGECITKRLRDDGVDTCSIRVDADNTTGVAFVAYYSDGSRQFIYHWRFAAAGNVTYEQIEPHVLENMKCLHLSGVNLSVNHQVRDTIYRLNNEASPDVVVSFDPNIRPEVLSADEIRELCKPILQRCDVFFPSEGEAKMFTQCGSDDAGCKALAAAGKVVVLKRGVKGSVVYYGDETIVVPPFKVNEIDPTGAGDSFAAAFMTGYLKNKPLRDCAVFANAVGALSVLKKGPMEGAPHLSEVLSFLTDQGAIDVASNW